MYDVVLRGVKPVHATRMVRARPADAGPRPVLVQLQVPAAPAQGEGRRPCPCARHDGASPARSTTSCTDSTPGRPWTTMLLHCNWRMLASVASRSQSRG